MSESQPPGLLGEVWRGNVSLGKAAPLCAVVERDGGVRALVWCVGIHGRGEWQTANTRESMIILAARGTFAERERNKWKSRAERAEKIAKAWRELDEARVALLRAAEALRRAAEQDIGEDNATETVRAMNDRFTLARFELRLLGELP